MISVLNWSNPKDRKRLDAFLKMTGLEWQASSFEDCVKAAPASQDEANLVERLCGLLLRGEADQGENAHDVALLHDQQLLAVRA